MALLFLFLFRRDIEITQKLYIWEMKRKTALYFYAETAAMRGRQFVIRLRPALIIYEVKKWDDIMKVGAYLEKLNAKEIHCDYISRASHYFTVEIHAIPEGELEGLGPNHIMRAVEWFCGTSLRKAMEQLPLNPEK